LIIFVYFCLKFNNQQKKTKKMKKFNALFVIGVLFLTTTFILSSGCKKKTDDPAPTPSAPIFVATAIPNGADYIEIVAVCTSDDILLTKVTIKDPLQNSYVYTGNQQLWVKDEYVTFPDVYLKQYGTWKLTFVGNRSVDGSSFTATASFSVTGK